MIEIDELVTLTNKWFYIAILSVIVFGIIDLIIYDKIRGSKINKQSGFKYFVLLFLSYISDLFIFIFSIKKCPHTFISYLFSIYIPLPTLFFIIIASISAAINVIKKYDWKIEAICDFLPYSFLIIGIKACFSLAYGSLCGLIWILVDIIITLSKMFTLTETFELYYEKKYD